MLAPGALAGKRILITGGGSGLGAGMAKHFADHGARVVLWGRREAKLREVADEIGEAAAVQAVDLRDADAVGAALDALWEDGPPTGLVNNAAANFVVPTKDLSPNGFDAVNSTIMRGSFVATHALGTRWIRDGLPGGVVSNLTTWVWSGSAFVTAAAMAKTAVHAMTMSLAVEWARYGIRVNAVAPGPFPSPYAEMMLSPTDKAQIGAFQPEGVPMKRLGEIAELGNLVGFLLADGCDYLTGATIPIDGGQRLAGPSTFAGMTELDDQDWADVREAAKAETAKSKAARG